MIDFPRINRILSIVTALFLTTSAFAEVVNVDLAKLEKLQGQGVPVIDIRGSDEWQQTGVIPGAKLITINSYWGSSAKVWKEQVDQVAKPDQPVILVCQSGVRSAIAARYLSMFKDYKTVYNAEGGMSEWVREKHPVVKP